MGYQCSAEKLYTSNTTLLRGMEISIPVVDQNSPSDFQNNKGYSCCLGYWKLVAIAEYLMHLGHMNQMTWAGSNLKAFYLWSSFHSTQKYY